MSELKTVTCFLFNTQAEEAAKFYTSIFPDGKVKRTTPWPDVGMGKPGAVLTVEFSFLGRDFVAVNCGNDIPFTEATSIQILCDTQDEIDAYWDKLLEGGGAPVECGWLKDKYGLFWQVTPRILPDMLVDPDREAAARAMKAMLASEKQDISSIKKAYGK